MHTMNMSGEEMDLDKRRSGWVFLPAPASLRGSSFRGLNDILPSSRLFVLVPHLHIFLLLLYERGGLRTTGRVFECERAL